MITPLSEELDGLEAIDDDYDFTVAPEEGSQEFDTNNNMNNNDHVVENMVTQTSNAKQAALARLNLVVTGVDTDSVSTLGNPTTPANLQRARVYNMLAIRSAQSGTSSMTDTSMDSRMPAIEQRINSMEESITNSLKASMARLLERINPPSPMSIRTQPPGGESAGRQNE